MNLTRKQIEQKMISLVKVSTTHELVYYLDILPKRVFSRNFMSILYEWTDKGYIEYGTSIRNFWFTKEGLKYIKR